MYSESLLISALKMLLNNPTLTTLSAYTIYFSFSIYSLLMQI